MAGQELRHVSMAPGLDERRPPAQPGPCSRDKSAARHPRDCGCGSILEQSLDRGDRRLGSLDRIESDADEEVSISRAVPHQRIHVDWIWEEFGIGAHGTRVDLEVRRRVEDGGSPTKQRTEGTAPQRSRHDAADIRPVAVHDEGPPAEQADERMRRVLDVGDRVASSTARERRGGEGSAAGERPNRLSRATGELPPASEGR